MATPTFSVATGSYNSAQTVTLSCSASGATIYYTTDGSTPTASSPTYAYAFAVSSSETVNAIAMLSGYANSNMASATYTITVSGSTRYEAENYNGATYADAMCSNGEGVSWQNGVGANTNFSNVAVATTGSYQVNVRYCSPAASYTDVYINGTLLEQLNFPSTGNNRAAPYATVTFTANLNAGTNAIKLQTDSTANNGGVECLDCIDVVSAASQVAAPTFSPGAGRTAARRR